MVAVGFARTATALLVKVKRLACIITGAIRTRPTLAIEGLVPLDIFVRTSATLCYLGVCLDVSLGKEFMLMFCVPL